MAISKIDALFNRAMEFMLGIKGAQSTPQAIDLDKVIPTFDMSLHGWTEAHKTENIITRVIGPINCAGGSGWTVNVVDPSPTATLIDSTDGNVRIMALDFYVSFDAAGLAAFVGKRLNFSVLLRDVRTGSYQSVPVIQATMDCVATVWTYRFRFPVSPFNIAGILIPQGFSCGASIGVEDGTNYPANTTRGHEIMGLRFPAGVPIPR